MGVLSSGTAGADSNSTTWSGGDGGHTWTGSHTWNSWTGSHTWNTWSYTGYSGYNGGYSGGYNGGYYGSYPGYNGNYPGYYGNYPAYNGGYTPSYLYYSSYINCYVDPNNPSVCYLYLTSPYPSPYPPSLDYSPYLGCYVDPNNPSTCYPYDSTYPSYPNPYSSSPYQTTTTESSIVSIVTQTSYATQTPTPAPAMVVSTFTSVVTTPDYSSLYGIVIAVLLVGLGACVFLLLLSAPKTNGPPQSYGGTGHYCGNCGNYLNQLDRFCGKCGTQQTP